MKSIRPQDPPLIVRAIRRVRKGVYEARITHESGHFYGYERIHGIDKAQALINLQRILPSAMLPPKAKIGKLLQKELKELQVAIALTKYDSGE